jgi:hypothetical protein
MNDGFTSADPKSRLHHHKVRSQSFDDGLAIHQYS